ncbi:RING-H2 finger protein ATL38-like [Rhodamnia argentea]|uniref:RING-type E3 ubiquitin transferase n=1 Tax=Rhodamnia argentea TaxID=178133 RepID=A0A8B8QL72_9MYRT|nr:RING-H2 finger protein ATL38-like [Rhodamnia argentea]
MISSGINLVMTVIGFAVSTMFIVFVCTRLICARIQLNASRRSFALAGRSDLSILERGLHGLEPVVVSNFPTKKYSDEFFSAVGDSQCTVCLAEYHCEDMLRILPSCGHSFHATCIDIWLQQHSTCPVCRISLREFSEKKRSMQPLFSSALRPHRGMETVRVHSPHCPLAAHNFTSRANYTHRMDPIREDRFATMEGRSEPGESIHTLDEPGQFSKDKGNGHTESQSNA